MTPAFSPWKALDWSTVALLPEGPGVFEIANLVRTTLFIGAATDSLVASVTNHLETPSALHARAGRLYFRYAPAEDAERIQTDLLARYGERHGGAQPPAQTRVQSTSRPARHLKAV